jgi:uncharacterized protein YcfL
MRFTVNTQSFIHCFILALLAVVFASCATPTKDGPYIPNSQQATVEDVAPVVLYEKGLLKWIAADRTTSQYTTDGRLVVKANLRNQLGESIKVQAQTQFKDVHGFSIDDDTAWQTLIFSPNESKTYTTTSMKNTAENYTIRIRFAR